MRLPTGWLVDAAALRKGCVIVAGMALVLTGLRAVAAWGDAGKEDRLAGVFRPYETAPPPSGSPASGTRISAESWEMARDFLPSEILERVRRGEFSFTVAETTDLPVSKEYIEATRLHAGEVRLSSDGRLQNYVAGLPFPFIELSDPQAGLKLAWNVRYRDFGDSMQCWQVFRILSEDGSLSREIENYYVVVYGMHRPGAGRSSPNRWQKEGILYKEFAEILRPSDLKGMMAVKHRYDDDSTVDQDWVYAPTARKVRRTFVRQEDASLDSSFLREDFFAGE